MAKQQKNPLLYTNNDTTGPGSQHGSWWPPRIGQDQGQDERESMVSSHGPNGRVPGQYTSHVNHWEWPHYPKQCSMKLVWTLQQWKENFSCRWVLQVPTCWSCYSHHTKAGLHIFIVWNPNKSKVRQWVPIYIRRFQKVCWPSWIPPQEGYTTVAERELRDWTFHPDAKEKHHDLKARRKKLAAGTAKILEELSHNPPHNNQCHSRISVPKVRAKEQVTLCEKARSWLEALKQHLANNNLN